MSTYLNWNNLKQQRCPKCLTYLKKDYKYSCPACSFSISLGKYFEIAGKNKSLEEMADTLLKRVKNNRKIIYERRRT